MLQLKPKSSTADPSAQVPRICTAPHACQFVTVTFSAATPYLLSFGKTATAFLDNHKGAITLNQLVVTAVVDGDLPRDSIDQLVSIR